VTNFRPDDHVEIILRGFPDMTPRARAELTKMAEEYVGRLVGTVRECRRDIGVEDIENAATMLRLRGPLVPRRPTHLSIGLRTAVVLTSAAGGVFGGLIPEHPAWAIPWCAVLTLLAVFLTAWDLAAERRNG
jgi:hypothetical protein